MKTLKTFLLLAAACLFCAGAVEAKVVKHQAKEDQSDFDDAEVSDVSLIDMPTAGVLDYYGLQSKTRFFSGGSVLEEVGFGVLPRLNLGASGTLENLIGTDSALRLVRPAIQAKYRFYDGSEYIPAFALGYDGQGYYYSSSADKFLEKERGLYLQATHSVFDRSFQIHPGINMSDFRSNSIFCSLGASFTVEDSFALLAEWDNIQRFDESRFNAGLRFYMTPFFQLDLAVRDIGKNTQFEDGSFQRPERIVQLRYNTNF